MRKKILKFISRNTTNILLLVIIVLLFRVLSNQYTQIHSIKTVEVDDSTPIRVNVNDVFPLDVNVKNMPDVLNPMPVQVQP